MKQQSFPSEDPSLRGSGTNVSYLGALRADLKDHNKVYFCWHERTLRQGDCLGSLTKNALATVLRQSDKVRDSYETISWRGLFATSGVYTHTFVQMSNRTGPAVLSCCSFILCCAS